MKKQVTARLLRPLSAALIVALAGLARPGLAADIPCRILKTNGQIIQGQDVSYRASMEQYVVRRGDIQLNIDKAEVARIEVPEPAGLRGAIASVKGGQPRSAIPALRQIVKDYQLLMHDVTAARYLGEAELASNNAGGAVSVLQQVVDNYGFGALPGDLINVYLDALQAANQETKVKAILRRMIEEGSRGAAAVALVKRGDLLKKEAKYKQALLDGYLRTVVLFQDEKSIRPKALYYAAKCFQELNQMSHADKMKKLLVDEFPRNKFTQMAQAGK